MNLGYRRLHPSHIAVLTSIRDAVHAAEAEVALRERQGNCRIVSFRLPSTLLASFDTLARSAGCSRSQLLRQIAAAYLCHLERSGIELQGSLIDGEVFSGRHSA